MKTTLNLDDDLLRQVKQVAASTGTTLTSVVEAALREALRPAPSTAYVFDPPIVHGTRLPQVDVTDREALYEHLDALP